MPDETDTTSMSDADIAAEESKLIDAALAEATEESIEARESEKKRDAAREKAASKSDSSASDEQKEEETDESADEKKTEDKKKSEKASSKGIGAVLEPTEKAFGELLKLAKAGEFKELFAAFGLDLDGMNVPAKRFADLRQLETRNRQAHQQRVQQLQQQTAQVQEMASKVEAKYRPLVEAHQILESGDLIGALEKFVGEPLDKISERAAQQQLHHDPRTAKLEAKMREMERAEQERLQQQKQQQAQIAEQKQLEGYFGRIKDAFSSSENPTLATLAKEDPTFAQEIYRIQVEERNKTGNSEMSAQEAADELLDRLGPRAKLLAKAFSLLSGEDEAEKSSQPTKQAEKTDGAGKSPKRRTQREPAPKTLEEQEAELRKQLQEEVKREYSKIE